MEKKGINQNNKETISQNKKDISGEENKNVLLERKIDQISKEVQSTKANVQEILWAEVFHSTINNSKWLNDKSFSPGRWAVGYPFLYVLYRVLNEFRPQKILDLGLGQSSHMIAQYAAYNNAAEHIIVEHDPVWIQFFLNGHTLPENSRIVQLNRKFVPYKTADQVRVFEGFKDRFQSEKFDLISIDAPFGGDMKIFSRIDILSILPNCIKDQFVILIDDAERSGENNTVAEIESVLKEHDIEYAKGDYRGSKKMVLFCDKTHSFFTSM